jgi:hypothetical protein
MAYSKNKTLGISRPPSAYALWCRHVKAKGTKLPVRRRFSIAGCFLLAGCEPRSPQIV